MRKIVNIIIILIAITANVINCFANDESNTEKIETEGILPFPYVLYTPETGFGAGISFMYYHNPDSENILIKPNIIQLSGLYTEKNQISSYLKLERYFNGDEMKLELNLTYQDMPMDFWGVGTNTPDSNEELFSMRTYGGESFFITKSHKYLSLGGHYEFYRYDITKKHPGGLLDLENIRGKDGTTISGFGFKSIWDSRDKLFFSTEGTYFDSKLLLYSKFYGSEYNFLLLDLDYRRFIGLGGRNVLAFHGILNSRFGDVPFQKKAMIGGSKMLRGYYLGRYIDNHQIAVQAELRYHIWWRFAGVVFTSMGQLAPEPSKFSTHNLKASAGLGLRFLVDKDELVFLRADFAITEFGPQIYLEALEAF
jgi:outer membrane protein assembly factor BamA